MAKPDGIFYETFIRRAYGNIHRTTQHGADADYMRRLVYSENPNSAQSRNFEEYLAKVRYSILDAINEFFRNDLTSEEHSQLEVVQKMTIKAQSSEELGEAINMGLTITQRFK